MFQKKISKWPLNTFDGNTMNNNLWYSYKMALYTDMRMSNLELPMIAYCMKEVRHTHKKNPTHIIYLYVNKNT